MACPIHFRGYSSPVFNSGYGGLLNDDVESVVVVNLVRQITMDTQLFSQVAWEFIQRGGDCGCYSCKRAYQAYWNIKKDVPEPTREELDKFIYPVGYRPMCPCIHCGQPLVGKDSHCVWCEEGK